MPFPCEYLPATGTAQQELVLLHGWGCNREVWRPLLVFLRPWANITLLDLPGCAPGLAPDFAAGQGAALSELLPGILACCPERAVYVGWSLGGQIASELAVRRPECVEALVTVCSNPRFLAAHGWPGMAVEDFREFRSAVEVDPIAGLKRFDILQAKGSREPRQLVRQLQSQLRDPASEALLLGLGWLEILDQREALRTVSQPQLHLQAEKDALVPVVLGQSLGTLLAGEKSATVSVIPGAGHLAPLESPAEVAQEIRAFLAASGHLKRRPAAPLALEKKEVADSFSRAAAKYDSAAHLQQEVGERLLSLLEPAEGAPTTVLDLGCGTGYFSAELQNRFPEAQYLGLDLARGMVEHARERSGNKCNWLVADAESLPLARESVDLVFSSLAIQWCYRLDHLVAELARVLAPGGLCAFTTLGPHTLYELRAAWAAVDTHQHVNTFLPVAALEAAAARIPDIEITLERREFRMEYERVRELLDELKALGAHNMNRSRPAGLTSRRALQGMLQAYETRRTEGVLPATYDVIFGVLKKT